jgi:hypothetical protein
VTDTEHQRQATAIDHAERLPGERLNSVGVENGVHRAHLGQIIDPIAYGRPLGESR